MHYHNMFLVKAKSKKHALCEVESFLEQFDENLEVPEYKEYLSARRIKRMAEYYKVDETDLATLASKLEDWDGMKGGLEFDTANGGQPKLYGLTTSNPQGEWDWYQFGGRFMLNELERKYSEFISHKKEGVGNVYWNPYYDKEIIGKTVLVKFPDGTSVECRYGNDVEYAIKEYVGAHPEDSEVIDATNEGFFKEIEALLKYREESLKWSKQQLEEYKKKDDGLGMLEYYQEKVNISENQLRWQVEDYFWNITSKSRNFDKEEIAKSPKNWFLVNVDLHT